jgi:WD40 repeat protein
MSFRSSYCHDSTVDDMCFHRHLDSVRSVSLHTKDMLIASASDDGTVKLWDLMQSSSRDAGEQKK